MFNLMQNDADSASQSRDLNMATVRAVDVSKTYGEGEAAVKALCTVSLEVGAGEYLAVMGPTGSG